MPGCPAAGRDQALLDIQQRHVGLGADQAQQIIAMRLNAARAAIPAGRSRRNLARGSEALQPTHGARDAETLGRRVARHAFPGDRLYNPFAKIVGKRDPRRLLLAAAIMNLEGSVWSRDAMRRVQLPRCATTLKPD
jgi:hypothetical protein